MKYCQGPLCHTYTTKDRIRGSKGDKHYETRKRSSFYYGKGNFCDQRCMYDWIDKHIEHGLCLLYTSPSPRDGLLSRMPSSA